MTPSESRYSKSKGTLNHHLGFLCGGEVGMTIRKLRAIKKFVSFSLGEGGKKEDRRRKEGGKKEEGRNYRAGKV